MPEISVWAIPAFQDNYIWVAQRGSSVLVVDPGDADVVISALEQKGLELVAILITHHHWDHTNGLADLTAVYDVPVYGPKVDLERIPQINIGLEDGDKIQIDPLALSLQVIGVPGHTLDHIAYYGLFDDQPLTFCGDTLFSGGCGRLFEGDAQTMHASMQKLAALPANTKVCCTHEYTLANLQFALAVEPDNQALRDYHAKVIKLRERDQSSLPSNIGLEMAINPFMRTHEPTVRQAAERQAGNTLPLDGDVFATIRSWKDNF